MATLVGSIRAKFEQAIAENANEVPDTGGMYLAARLANQKKTSPTSTTTTSPKNTSTRPFTTSQKLNTVSPKPKKSSSRPPTSPSKKTTSRKSTSGSVTSHTVSESESECSSGELRPQTTSARPPLSPKRTQKDRGGTKKRGSVTRTVDIPESIDEEKEGIVGCTIVTGEKDDLNASLNASLVLNFDEEAGCFMHSPRKCSVVGSSNLEQDFCDQSHSSRGSTLSRSSPQIRRLPRDLDFDSDDSSMSDDDSSASLVKQRKLARKPLPKPRYW